MSNDFQFSPSPSEFGLPVYSRRALMATAASIAFAGGLAACGSSAKKAATTTAAPTAAPAATQAPAATTAATQAPAATTAATQAPAATTASVGTVTFGSNGSDANPKKALAAAFAATGIDVKVNTVDHNTFQDNITNYLQQPDDVFTWFSGYRMRFFADKGLVGDISDVWKNLPDMPASFKAAATGNDGKQYLVTSTYYPWAVFYRKSLFAEKGYTIPKTKADLIALATKMKADGLIPFAYANDGKWPVQGTFDILNMRINGYQYHVDLLAGKEKWTDPKTKAVFTTWAELLPFHQESPNGRTWQQAATALEQKKAGMYYLGSFVATNSKDQTYLDDLDFFSFPELDPAIGADALDAPIDGFMMAKNPKNIAGAKALLTALGGTKPVEAFLKIEGASIAANAKADTSFYGSIQKKGAALIASAKSIAQFLDRDTSPDFVKNVISDNFAAFVADPTQVDSILKTIEDQKGTYLK
jgi:multiple sugar transport system substrate-binding protein